LVLGTGGYFLDSLSANVLNVNFLNLRQVTLNCGDSAELGGGSTGDPHATVVLPTTGCTSTDFTSSFDVGTSADSDDWDQFVEFGGDPSATGAVIEQTIDWNEEVANYLYFNFVVDSPNAVPCAQGSSSDCIPVLQVPTTLVRLANGDVNPAQFCGPDDPDTDGSSGTGSNVFDCLFTQDIDLGTPVTAGYMQVTEVFKFLGDPPRFR
jgi:hypothetical protein